VSIGRDSRVPNPELRVPPFDVAQGGPEPAEGPNPDSRLPSPGYRVHCPVEVRFRDCDPMGHVNNAVYLTYLEIARFAYWKAAEIDRLGGDVSYIMARVEIDFRAAAVPGDVLDVGVSVTGIGRRSFSMAYEIRDRNGRLVSSATSVQVMYDYAAGASVPVPDAVRARLGEFEGRQL
jgi:acyl-CoA thioester hydrolase